VAGVETSETSIVTITTNTGPREFLFERPLSRRHVRKWFNVEQIPSEGEQTNAARYGPSY
jgi:hypothetical protein